MNTESPVLKAVAKYNSYLKYDAMDTAHNREVWGRKPLRNMGHISSWWDCIILVRGMIDHAKRRDPTTLGGCRPLWNCGIIIESRRIVSDDSAWDGHTGEKRGANREWPTPLSSFPSLPLPLSRPHLTSIWELRLAHCTVSRGPKIITWWKKILHEAWKKKRTGFSVSEK